VDDLDPAARLALVLVDLVGGEEAGVDEGVEHGLGSLVCGGRRRPYDALRPHFRNGSAFANSPRRDGACPRHHVRSGGVACAEDRDQLVPLARGAGAFGGDEIAEDLADDRNVIAADAVDGGLGVLRQRSTDTADVPVGASGEQTLVAVALLPQPGGGKGRERQRAALALHLGDHLVHELVVLEAVAAGHGRLHQGAAQGRAGERLQGCELGEDRGQCLVVVAAHEEVVAHAQEHVHVRLEGDSADEVGEACLHAGLVLGEQLLELVDGHQGVAVSPAPAAEELDGDLRLLETNHQADGLGVAGHLRCDGLSEGDEGCAAGRADEVGPVRRLRGNHARPDERGLACPGRADESHQMRAFELGPHGLDLGLAAEEVLGV